MKTLIFAMLLLPTLATAMEVERAVNERAMSRDELTIKAVQVWTALRDKRQTMIDDIINSPRGKGEVETGTIIQLKKEIRLLNDCIDLKAVNCNYEY